MVYVGDEVVVKWDVTGEMMTFSGEGKLTRNLWRRERGSRTSLVNEGEGASGSVAQPSGA